MHIRRFATCAALVSVLVGSASTTHARGGHGPMGASPTAIPFTLDAGGLVLVPVSLGDRTRLRCVLDTGASRTIVTDRLAASLGLQPVAQANVVSSAGTSMHELVQLPPMSVAGITRPAILATVLPSARVRELSERAACVIGHDFLSTNDYTIDYEKREFSWDLGSASGPADPSPVRPRTTREGAAEPISTRLSLVLSEGRYVVVLPQSSRSDDTVRLVPDSGASEVVLFRQPELPALPLAPPLTALRGTLVAATGQREVSGVRVERLRVGAIELTDTPAFLVSRRSEGRTGAQGLLPLRLFARVSFRNSEGALVVTAR